ncbi:MAG: TonB-dependent receptor domain-containing protein [Steroidobacteraceae bacterium]
MTHSIRSSDAAASLAAAVAFALAAAGARAADPSPPLQEVTVTGSRITQSPGMFTPTPVTAVTQAELVKMAPTNIIDSLTDLPQFYGNSTYQQALGGQSPSGSEVNLRGANTSSGISRTLVLLDGRRTVANSRFGAVDIGQFPDQLISRVDVVTGGASATYGTDAVAGVVNFILDTKFEGVKLEAQGGITARNDGPSDKFSFTFGHQFGEKLHIIGSVSEFNQDAIDDFSSLQSRPWFNQASRVPGPKGGPTWVVAPYVIPTNFSYNGTVVLPGTSVNGMQFSPNGQSLLPAPTGVLGSVGDACNCLATANETYGVNSMDEVLPSYRRKNAFLHATYDLNDKVQIYAQGMWSDDSSNVRWQSAALLGPWGATIGLDNPFLSPAVAGQIGAALATLPGTTTGPNGAGYRPVYPGRDALSTQYFSYGVFLNNVPGNPLGETRQITENATHEGTLGFKANIAGDWQLDGYAQTGSTRESYFDNNGTRVDRLFFAMDAITPVDATGKPIPNAGPICRVASPYYNPQYYQSFANCAPINLFGGWANISPQAAAYVSGPQKLATQDYDLTNGELAANGTLFEGWAGPIKAAIGASWRRESVFQTTPDPSNEYPSFLDGTLIGTVIPTQPTYFRGDIPQGFYINQYGYTQPWPAGAPTVTDVNGKPTGGIPGLYYVPTGFLGDANSSTIMFSSERTFGGQTRVGEAFTELNVPLLKDKPFVESLSTDLAARWANYSGPGHVWAWKGGLDWALNDSVRVRATRSRDVRAASLEERFDTTRGGVTVNNPWVLTNGAPTTQSGASYSGGNSNLKPELADTWTAGIVFTPTLVQGFSTSVDWYSIDIQDAIDKPASQDIVNAAFAGDPQYQALVKLDASNNIVEVDQYFINFAKQYIQGVDFEAAYHRGIRLLGGGAEDIALRAYATDMMKNATLTQFGTYNEMAGQVGTALSLPKQKVTANFNYDNGPVALFVQERYISAGILDHTLLQSPVAIPGVQTINDNHVGSVFYTDVNLTYTLPVPGTLQVWGEVQNVFDRAPPATAAAYGRAGSAELNPQLYDTIGRRYVLGIRYAF